MIPTSFSHELTDSRLLMLLSVLLVVVTIGSSDMLTRSCERNRHTRTLSDAALACEQASDDRERASVGARECSVSLSSSSHALAGKETFVLLIDLSPSFTLVACVQLLSDTTQQRRGRSGSCSLADDYLRA